MKTIGLVHLFLALLWARSPAQTLPTGMVNGSFEDGFNGWTHSGNVSVEPTGIYNPTDGSRLAAFNAGNSAPNGSISQTVPIENTLIHFERLRFDVGNFGISSIEMRLRVQISKTSPFSDPFPLVDEVISIPGITGGTTRWQEAAYQFLTPDTGQVSITLTDVSAQTHAADLVVDHLRIDKSIYLGVHTSEDTYFSGVTIEASPGDLWGTTELIGTNRLLYYFNDMPAVTLSAPAVANGKPFLRWLKDGVDYDENPVTVVTPDADLTMTALYDRPVELKFDAPAEARCFVGTGPVAPLAWSGSIWNNTGSNQEWVASAVVPNGSPDPVFFKVTPSHGVVGNGSPQEVHVCITANALQLPAGVHHGLIRISSGFGVAETEITLTVIDPARHFTNGSFESGSEGWNVTGNATVESADIYAPGDGTKLVAFNAGNSTPNGVIARTIPTEPGVTYLLHYQMGTLSFNTHEQTLDVKVLDARNPLAPPITHMSYILTGSGGGQSSWTPNFDVFVAQSDLTTIFFSDLSSTTTAIDLLLDDVYILNENFGFTVTTLADENDATLGTGSGDSLREVIAAAGGIPGSHAISFAAQLDNGVIALSGTQLATTTPLAIDASALPSGITIDAGGQSRVLQLGADSALQNIRLQSGNSAGSPVGADGGGILATGNLLLSGVTLANNTSPSHGGGIMTLRGLSASNCLFTANHAGSCGGALLNRGAHALVESSVISGNSADANGGGLTDSGPWGSDWLILSRCTVSNNSAGQSGGGYSGLTGYKDYGALIAENTTFSGNTANEAGGAIFVQGRLDLKSCTVSANSATGPAAEGGGIAATVFPGITFENSIVAGNSAASFPEISSSILSCPFPPAETGNNLLSGDPKLAPLGQYGGPTLTMPPRAGSPAINAAVLLAGSPVTDQRGYARPSGLAPDIGAVELQEITVNTFLDENDGVDVGNVSLRDALGVSSPAPPELIGFDPSLDAGTIGLTEGELIATRRIIIDASDLPNRITVSGNNASRVFHVTSGNLEINGVKLSNGFTSGGGANLRIEGEASVSMKNSTLHNGIALGSGGAIWLEYFAQLTLDHCNVSNNVSAGSGGGIFAGNYFPRTTITNSLIERNVSFGSGGGIYNRGHLTLNSSSVANNYCEGDGGGVYSHGVYGANKYGSLTVINSTFFGNAADGSGGGLTYGGATLNHCTISRNTAGVSDGGINRNGNPYPFLGLTNSIVAGNQAPASPDISVPPEVAQGNNLLSGDPKLAPPGDYGGFTPTMPPLPGSPVIDAAVMLDDTPPNDQIGGIRPQGPLPDLGAVEAFPFSSLVLMDNDCDGIDDRLEPAYQMIVGEDDSGRDSDGDSSNDGMELANMTDPQNAESLLKILSFTRAAGFGSAGRPVFDVTFTSFPGLSYSLECDQSLQFQSPSARCSVRSREWFHIHAAGGTDAGEGFCPGPEKSLTPPRGHWVLQAGNQPGVRI